MGWISLNSCWGFLHQDWSDRKMISMFFRIIKLLRNNTLSFSLAYIFWNYWWIVNSLISQRFIYFKISCYLRRLLSVSHGHLLLLYILEYWFFLLKVHRNFMLKLLIQSSQLLVLLNFFKTIIRLIWRINGVIFWTTFTTLKLFLLP